VKEAFGRWDDEEQRARFAVRAGEESDQVIELDAEPIGCMCVEWHPDHAFIVRVQVLPEFQRRGIGSHVVREVIAAASARQLPVRLQVLKVNPARSYGSALVSAS
jgi:ribosomal protein S18 acetylase RimI-like enzyme